MRTINLAKKFIKGGLQHLAANWGHHTRSFSEPQLLILMYHRILPLDDIRTQYEEPGMIVTPDTFSAHMQIISEYFEPMHLSQWIELRNNHRKLPDKTCVITFDDGWVDNFEFAYPILQTMQVPATIFVVSNLLGSVNAFWPERLARLIFLLSDNHSDKWTLEVLDWLRSAKTSFGFSDTPPSREELTELITHAKQFSDSELHSRIDSISDMLAIDLQTDTPSLLNWEQLTTMTNSGLIEAGSHTCNHTRLNTETPGDILEYEIRHSKTVIEEHIGQKVKTFCFPNGDYSTDALTLVKKHYDCAVTTETGWNNTSTAPYMLHRTGIHQDISNSRTKFLACLSGWF